MVDFSLLNDPKYRELARLAALERQRSIQERLERLNGSIEFCLDHEDELSLQEVSFLRSISRKVALFGVLTEAQQSWLSDIDARLRVGESESQATQRFQHLVDRSRS